MTTRVAHDTSYLQAMAKFRSGDQIAAAPRRLRAVAEARLTYQQRKHLPRRVFALPELRHGGKGGLPLTDARHANNAASRLEQMRIRGTVTPAQYRRARAAIVRAQRHFGPATRAPRRSNVVQLRRPPQRQLRRAADTIRNPLAVRAGYRKGRALQADLTRYYDTCTVSRSAARFRGKARRDDYCARVAWTRARNTGRYRDYPGFTREVSMATMRRRNARGQFTRRAPARRAATTRRRAREEAPRRRAASRRRAAPRRAREVTALAEARRPRRRAPARRRAAPRHRMREAFMPMPSRTGHIEWDMEASEARRPRHHRRPARRSPARRRRYVREAAAPMVVVANEYPGQPRTARGRFARGRRGASRRRRSGYARERVCANRRRRRDGRFAPGRLGTRRVGASRRRGGGSRRRGRNALGQFTGRAARRSRVRGYTRAGGVRVSSYLREEDMLLNPLSGPGFMDNPISGGEIATVFVTAGGGWIITDIISRYLETTSSTYTPATGETVLPNAVGILGMPSWTNILVQAGISVVGLGLGGYLGRRGDGGYGVAALNGLGVGAGLHLIGQLFNALMARWAGSKTSATGTTPNGTMARLWAPEIAAQNAQYQALAAAQAATPPGTVTPGFAGLPGTLGAFYEYNPMNPYGVPTGPNGAVINPVNPFGQPTVQLPNGQWAAVVNPANPFGVPTQPGQPPTLLTQPVAGGMMPQAVVAPVAAPVAVAPVAAPAAPVAVPVASSGSGASSPWTGADEGCGCMGFTPYSTFPE